MKNPYEALFEMERNKILGDHAVARASMATEDRSEDFKDEDDLAASTLSQSMHVQLKHREAKYLKKIEAALSRIRSGTFGVCENCEEPIEERRLKARPTTTFCLACKELSERREQSGLMAVAVWG